jgi:hypothetical protein
MVGLERMRACGESAVVSLAAVGIDGNGTTLPPDCADASGESRGVLGAPCAFSSAQRDYRLTFPEIGPISGNVS